ncbi:MAG: hypothetical protein HKM23_09370 [Nitrosopumilus sp.]|nr:hypothetical protein [Nitrosopumilus sp.]NNL59527.1 hypothetical protein [Nitrosopumilus sp.]
MRLSTLFIIFTISMLVASSLGQQAIGYGGPPEQSSSNNYTVEISSDDTSYLLGDSIAFSGKVNKYDEERNLRISIFDSANNLILTQKTPVSEDLTFNQSMVLNEKFHDGKYSVKTQYGTSKATIEIIFFEINSNNLTVGEESSNAKIPDWIKTNAGWWADGSIDDSSFVQGIQFLIKEGLMKI